MDSMKFTGVPAIGKGGLLLGLHREERGMIPVTQSRAIDGRELRKKFKE